MNIILLLQLTFSGIAAASLSCPTVTSNLHCPTCAVAQCIPLEIVNIPCGCPNPAPTTIKKHPCSEGCVGGGCAGTEYIYNNLPCSTLRTPSISSPSCPTITTTVVPTSCGRLFCPLQSVCSATSTTATVPCSCINKLPLKTATVTAACCNNCHTTTRAVYLPCAFIPTTPPVPSVTKTVLGFGSKLPTVPSVHPPVKITPPTLPTRIFNA